MHNKILLGAAVAIAAMQTNAVPFAPTDARAIGMGGTGVAAAKTVHAVQFNPSLLSSADESDDFGFLFPQVGGYFSDEHEFIDAADEFVDADYVTAFDSAITNITTPIDNIQSQISIIDGNSDETGDLAVLATATGILATNSVSLTDGTGQLTVATQALNDGLATLSQKALRGGLGFGAGIAIPSKKFSVAISANNSTTFSGELVVAQSDLDTLLNYTTATDAYAGAVSGYAVASDDIAVMLNNIDTLSQGTITQQLEAVRIVDEDLPAKQTALTTASTNLNTFSYGGTGQPASEGSVAIFKDGALADGADSLTLASEAHIIAVALTEVALSVSREFDFSGRQVAIGITPKLQRMDVYDYIVSVDSEVDGGDVSDFGVDDTGFNLDIGVSTRFGKIEQGTVGLVVKNLLSNELESINGHAVEINPQVRAGVVYQAFGWINLAADLDLIENDPVAFEEPSQFFAVGLEADVFGFMQLRGGFRTNIAASDQQVVSGGFGLSPFSLFHVDFGFYTNTSDPKKEIGGVFEFGVDW